MQKKQICVGFSIRLQAVSVKKAPCFSITADCRTETLIQKRCGSGSLVKSRLSAVFHLLSQHWAPCCERKAPTHEFSLFSGFTVKREDFSEAVTIGSASCGFKSSYNYRWGRTECVTIGPDASVLLRFADISTSVSVPDDKWLSSLEGSHWLDHIR